MRDLVDIPNTSDPLTILRGAESLKNQQDFIWSLRYDLKPEKSRVMESAEFFYHLITNGLVRGYSYDTNTGIRTVSTYNTSDNWETGLKNSLSFPFNHRKSIILSSSSELKYGHATDIIGINEENPSPFTVRNLFTSENISLVWTAANWLELTCKADLQLRHTSSKHPEFNTINAFTANYGGVAIFKLPYNLSLSTDITLFTRNGYESAEMNHSDLVWNARIAYTFGKGRWTMMLDGFDLLHQLNSVRYAVNAQGRTVTYVNTLPRFLIFHIQYHLDIKPGRKK